MYFNKKKQVLHLMKVALKALGVFNDSKELNVFIFKVQSTTFPRTVGSS